MSVAGSEVTGAVGDTVTALPLLVGVAVVADLRLTWLLVWFGVFQVVWGAYYGLPLSVEPMKALSGLLLAGALTTGEFLVAGLLASVVLLAVGATDSLARVESSLAEPVVRGVQFAVALVLLRTGVELGVADPLLAGGGAALALVVLALDRWNLTALAVLAAGGVLAVASTGVPVPAVPPVPVPSLGVPDLTGAALGATVAQLSMTVGNAAVATSLLLEDLYDRDVSPDELSVSMGLMNLVAVPLGGLPMCHGSGGVAGKHTFGARTVTANLVVGGIYLALGVGAVGLLAAYPEAILGVVLVLVALGLARTSFRTDDYALVAGVGVLGLLTNVGLALLAGVLFDRARSRWLTDAD